MVPSSSKKNCSQLSNPWRFTSKSIQLMTCWRTCLEYRHSKKIRFWLSITLQKRHWYSTIMLNLLSLSLVANLLWKANQAIKAIFGSLNWCQIILDHWNTRKVGAKTLINLGPIKRFKVPTWQGLFVMSLPLDVKLKIVFKIKKKL